MGQAADDAQEYAEELYYEFLHCTTQARRHAQTLTDEELVQTVEGWAPVLRLTRPICETFRKYRKKLRPKQRAVLENEYANHHYLVEIDWEDGSDL